MIEDEDLLRSQISQPQILTNVQLCRKQRILRGSQVPEHQGARQIRAIGSPDTSRSRTGLAYAENVRLAPTMSQFVCYHPLQIILGILQVHRNVGIRNVGRVANGDTQKIKASRGED